MTGLPLSAAAGRLSAALGIEVRLELVEAFRESDDGDPIDGRCRVNGSSVWI